MPGPCPQPPLGMYACFLSGPSGRGRLQWAWSCWQRQGTTQRCRGCFLHLISITQVFWAAWTVQRRQQLQLPCTAACTGLLQHPIPSCSGPWCPECSSMAWDLGDNQPSIPCPTPSQALHIPGEEGGKALQSLPVPDLTWTAAPPLPTPGLHCSGCWEAEE